DPDRTVRPRGDDALANLAQRIARAAVHVAGLQAHDQRSLPARVEPVRAHPTLAVGLDDAHLLRADAEHAQRPVDRAVALGTDDDLDARCTGQTIALDVPAGLAQHLGAAH